MSIASEITRISNAKSSIASAIAEKGVTVPSGTLIDGMPTLIGQIQTGITPSGNIALTPSTSAQTGIDVSTYATASVDAITKELLASLDADFAAENIKKDVNLFGLVGTLAGGGGEFTCIDIDFTPTANGAVSIYTGISNALPCIIYAHVDKEYAHVDYRAENSIETYILMTYHAVHETYDSFSNHAILIAYNNNGSPRNSVNNLSNGYSNSNTSSSPTASGTSNINGSLVMKSNRSGNDYVSVWCDTGTTYKHFHVGYTYHFYFFYRTSDL